MFVLAILLSALLKAASVARAQLTDWEFAVHAPCAELSTGCAAHLIVRLTLERRPEPYDLKWSVGGGM